MGAHWGAHWEAELRACASSGRSKPARGEGSVLGVSLASSSAGAGAARAEHKAPEHVAASEEEGGRLRLAHALPGRRLGRRRRARTASPQPIRHASRAAAAARGLVHERGCATATEDEREWEAEHARRNVEEEEHRHASLR